MRRPRASGPPVAWAHRWLAPLWSLALAGCALKTPPTQPEVLQQALPTTTTVRPTWAAASAAAGDVTNDWVSSFDDPGLVAVVVEAVANNPDVRQAAARVSIARQSAVVVGAALKPQVGGQFGFAGTKISGDSSAAWAGHATASVSWEIDVWGKLRAQRAAAQANYDATALDFAFAIQSLAATTAESWYLTIETLQLVQLARQAVTIYTGLLDLVKVKRAAGRVSDLDVAEASANLSTAQSQLQQAEALYAEARRGLETLLGRYPAAELEVADSFTALPPAVPAGLPSELLERRPDLLAAERQVLAAFRQQEAAKLSLLPSFSLNFLAGLVANPALVANPIFSVLNLNPWLAHGLVGMSVPFYQGGRLQAQVRIASAEQEQAIARYGGVVLTAFREVENALNNEWVLSQRLTWDERALADRTEAVRIGTIRYEAGSIDLLFVLLLQADQLSSQAGVIRIRTAQRTNRIQLHLALGGGFDSIPAAALVAPPPSAMQPAVPPQ